MQCHDTMKDLLPLLSHHFYQVGVYGGNGYSDDALDGYYYAAVALALDFDKYAFHPLEVATDDAYRCALGEVDLRWVEEVERLVVAATCSDEVVHLRLGHSNLATVLVCDVLQMGDGGFDLLDD